MKKTKLKQNVIKKSAIEKQIEVDAKTESKVLIGEIYTKPHELVRIYRIKYVKSPTHHIDLRFWHVNPGEDLEEGQEPTFFPTKKGCQISEGQFKELIKFYLPLKGK